VEADRYLDELFAVDDWHSLALVVVHRGELVAERYAPDVTAETPLISWSMAKSITHALVGLLVGDGRMVLDAPALVPEWRAGDDRAAITVQHLLEMRPGLRFVEDYVDADTSHCLEMLFGSGQHDVGSYAASLPLDHPPGTHWNYSSGTTNIVARCVGDVVAADAGAATASERTAVMRAWMNDALFAPIGMTSADPRFDAAGTFVGSSYVWATARDFARFGLLYLRDGEWEGRRVLPAGWAAHARTPVPVPATERFGYGAHWWLWRDEPEGFAAHGYEGQYLAVLPARDLVVVRLGKTPAECRPDVEATLRRVFGCFSR
jgi:CubicO group peptidase (beta-lactamase class C family)